MAVAAVSPRGVASVQPTRQPPPVVIVVGHDIDASAMPLTYERNRFVTDMLRHYACPAFVRKEGGGAADAASSDVFEWVGEPLPVVGVAEMTAFHDEAYVRYLALRETLSEVDERASCVKRSRAGDIQPPVSRKAFAQLRPPPRLLPDLVPIPTDEAYGLTGDNTPFVGMWRTIQTTVSGTLLAARLLACSGRFAAIHWFGGRHHAKRRTAGGFCFVNDVVLGVLELQKSLHPAANRILVVDLDAHHGDGTQAAFLHDSSVLTLSMHAHGVGIFPGTGGIEEIGAGLGRGFVMNIPLPAGATDILAVPLVHRAIHFALRKLGESLGAIVIVCGADALSGDPLGALNLTLGGMQSVVRLLLQEAAHRSLKVLLLGAGGYVDASCARLAGAITRDVLSCAAALRLGKTEYFGDSANLSTNLSVAVPDDCEHFTRYGPSFLMHGLPPAQVRKVQQMPYDSPMFLRMRRAAEKKALRHRIKGEEDGEEESSDDDEDDDDADEDEEEEEDEEEGDEEEEEEEGEEDEEEEEGEEEV
ncbi:putative histone deacetylase [Trypanosoma conorhini]|uniref:Putative histone deacetylase n=1 Tax=Trypanosoma conorhini TaxID=83891 RepID=A0A3S5IU21_9TRYP|nr:putative histone deacetylase [Trypanosoma conorhini]RNF24294.1 putative histone deacetylase [Trypanosoma conorhini]